MKTRQLVPILSIVLTAGVSAIAATPGDADGLLLNFHEVPLRAVVDYLGDKAGLMIVYDADVRGTVSATASRPVSAAEALRLLDDQLSRNNYTALLDGRTLTVMEAGGARTNARTPVFTLTNAAAIPVNNEIVTAILPVHSLNPAQLVKDLEPLIPAGDTVTANEAGNAVVMTASQKDIHRLAAIISALDSTAVSEVNVFTLDHADAKSVAEELKQLFQSAEADASRAVPRLTFGARFARLGGDGVGGSGDAKEKTAPTRPVFVADEQMNAIAASAPPDYMPMIARVVSLLDKQGEDLTEVEIFPLRHADPGEVVDEISALFAPPASAGNAEPSARPAGFQFGGPNRLPSTAPAATESSRLKRQATVTAVADRRTQSVIVAAAGNVMALVKRIVPRLDEGNAGVMKLTVFAGGCADAGTMQDAIASLFSSASSATRPQSPITTAWDARAQGGANSFSTPSATTGGGGVLGSGGGTGGLR